MSDRRVPYDADSRLWSAALSDDFHEKLTSSGHLVDALPTRLKNEDWELERIRVLEAINSIDRRIVALQIQRHRLDCRLRRDPIAGAHTITSTNL